MLLLINKKSFDEIVLTKKLKYVKEKLKKLGRMVIHSHIDASFFLENRGIPRFQKINDEERNHKVTLLKNEMIFMQKKAKSLEVINHIIKIFIGENKF